VFTRKEGGYIKIFRNIWLTIIFMFLNCGFYTQAFAYKETARQLSSILVQDDSISRASQKTAAAKKIFLTFDDGPSQNTLKILEILKENKVTATFFIIGKKAEENPEIIKKLHESGMCIASHSYSHDYKIYKSRDSYFEDLFKCDEIIHKLTGQFSVPVIRFPAGSYNSLYGKDKMTDIKNQLKIRGINYVDWNVSSADTASVSVPKDIIKGNIVNQCKLWRVSIALMHDAAEKNTTVEALPEIIASLKEKGYEFKTFNDMSPGEKQEMIKLNIMNR
jgi:peptidoglycan/xylan/chitin deacetylase (PgdA/CDA1 family)